MSVESTTLERSALERKDREELATIAQALGVKPPSRARKAEIVQLILELTGVESSAPGDATEPERTRATNGGPKQEASSVDDTTTETDAPEFDIPKGTTVVDVTDGAATGSGAASVAEAQGDEAQGDEAQPEEPPAEWELAAGESGSDARATTHGGDDAGATTVAATPDGGDADAQAEGSDASNGQTRGDRKPREQGKDDGKQGSERGGEADKAANKQGDGRGADQSRNEGRQGGERQGGDRQGGDQSAQDVDVNEPGNRRRRRRGRRGASEQQTHVEEYTGEPVDVEGLLDLRDEGYGFLRVTGYLPSKDDSYVSVKQARQFGLRKGDHVKGASRPALRNEKNPALLRIDLVNGKDPEEARKRRRFEDLTPLFPDDKLSLETADDPANMTARIVDLISPIGKGQRGLIVSPPKAGKTTIIKQIVRSIEANNPEVKLFVLQVDERPEEVTDMRRSLRSPSSEVVASTFDRPSDEHTQVAELTIERAKRLVEDGMDVCIVLDGITRLARAYNLAAPATGRIMSGGVDSGALYPPKKFFGAARNIEEGGSLTILGTALIETGSKMDEVIFEEFKGTGNMELRLDRRLSERRIYPAIDVDASSTRHEELLFPRNQLNLVWALRRVLSGLSSTDGGNAAALELLIDRMKTFRTNDEFLAEVAKNRLAAG
ncbi:MAG: transcription termination factor Rho [Acidimicrobiales bacterium]